MSNAIITVEGLSKKYQITHQSERVDTLREAIPAMAKRLFHRRGPNELPAKSSKEEFWALRGVSFDVEKGEVLGIIGKNGAGKSTLLKILSRITEPTEGQVRLKGRVASLLEVGTGFHPELTGRENVFLNGAVLGMHRSEIRRKFDEIVEFSGVSKFLDTPVKRYSSGMYVRLAFAVAAHLEPEIMIVDEVLAVGDMEFQSKCLQKMREISRNSGRTVLFVSHNVDVVQKLCDRVLLLEKGRVLINGPAEAAIKHYIHPEQEHRHTFPIAPPEAHDVEAFPTSLVVETVDGIPMNGLQAGSPFQMRVFFTLARTFEGFVVAVGFLTDRDVPLWTSWTPPRAIEPGSYEAVFRNGDVQLPSGTFGIAVGLSAQGKAVSYTTDAGKLVLTESKGGPSVPSSNLSPGLILNPMKVTISKLP